MTKRHFIALADGLRSILYAPPGFVRFTVEQREALLKEMCHFCREQNPNFDEEIFLGYIEGTCGPSGGTI